MLIIVGFSQLWNTHEYFHKFILIKFRTIMLFNLLSVSSYWKFWFLMTQNNGSFALFQKGIYYQLYSWWQQFYTELLLFWGYIH